MIREIHDRKTAPRWCAGGDLNRVYGILIGLLLCFVLPARADDQDPSYDGHPEALMLIDQMVAEEQFDRTELEAVFAGARKKESILKAIARPAEKTKAWHEYRKIFVTSKRTSQGLEFYRNYAASLMRAEREYGVPAELITAIIGVETRYGRNRGSYRVIDALSTLAFDYPPRSKFFGGELRQYLLMTREQGLPVTQLKGSYAGAMGYGQFIPSSYRAYAVDYDGDGVVDIIDNPVDAIGSVANYFRRHRWQPGEPVVVAARVGEGYRRDWMNDGLKPRRSVGDLAVGQIYPEEDFAPERLATAMEFEGDEGLEFWLGWQNFYVITRYNHSAMYAMAVYQLSQAIGQEVEGRL
jgi:membrane-bound lytic murein transglycosylase B